MKSISKTIVFFGTEDFSLAALQELINAQYNIGAVVTKPDTPRGRGQKLTSPAVKVLAEQNNIPVLQPSTLDDDFIEQLSSLLSQEPDSPVGVLSSYGKIVPTKVIDLFSPGIINIHPSLLPLYRGPSPIESAILNGDDKTGVSIMKLAAKMDAGPLYAQIEVPLNGTETKPELYNSLAQIGSSLLIEQLPSIIDGNLSPESQDDSRATYCPLLRKSDGVLSPSTQTATEAERRVRAYLGYPKTRLPFNGQDIIITKAHTNNKPKTPLDFKFRDGEFLVIDELIAPSGRTMSSDAYLRGNG